MFSNINSPFIENYYNYVTNQIIKGMIFPDTENNYTFI